MGMSDLALVTGPRFLNHIDLLHIWKPIVLTELTHTLPRSVNTVDKLEVIRGYLSWGLVHLWETLAWSIYSDLKPMYSFGKWWKWKFSLMGFAYSVVRVLALWIFLSETNNFLRKLHKTNIFGMPSKILP